MTTETITTIKLIASNGMILTDGNIYGQTIFLAEGKDINNFYEITEEEYNKILGINEEVDKNN